MRSAWKRPLARANAGCVAVTAATVCVVVTALFVRSLYVRDKISLWQAPDGVGRYEVEMSRGDINILVYSAKPRPQWYGLANVPFSWLAVVALVIALIAVDKRRHDRGVERGSLNRCVTCGYDLRASPGRCPECGRPVQTPR